MILSDRPPAAPSALFDLGCNLLCHHYDARRRFCDEQAREALHFRGDFAEQGYGTKGMGREGHWRDQVPTVSSFAIELDAESISPR